MKPGLFYINLIMDTNDTLPGLPHLSLRSVFCIGRNYVAHAEELNNEVPDQPLVFLKPASSITYTGPISLPAQSKDVHHEVELVVAIGKKGREIPASKALEYVAGYAVGIDLTARDIQSEAKKNGHPWSVAKGFDTFAPLSSFVKASDVANPQNLELQLSVNGTLRQQANTGLMIFPVAELIHYLSGIFTLQPGDLIFTGTPEGVASLQHGDVVEASLSNTKAHIEMKVR